MVDWEYLTYDAWSRFLSAVVDVFFREVQTRGLHKTPETGPVFFVAAPHCNQFFDPIVLNRHCHRRILYLCAKKSFDRALIGSLARFVRSIPVSRAQDYAFKGKGKIKVLDRYREPTRIQGIGTKFEAELKPGMMLALPKQDSTAEVLQVVSDTELILKKEFKSLEAIEMLSRDTGVAFKCVPHFDQSQVYDEVHNKLNEGACIGIFPEGGSHDRTDLLPLKAGIAVMALGAAAANPEVDIKIVPCGMNYFHPDKFRSRAVIEYGTPFSVPKDLAEQFKLGGDDKRNACSKFLGLISDALKSVTVTTPDYETLMVAQAARRLYKAPFHKAKFSQVVKFNRHLVAGYLHFKDEPRVVQLRTKVLSYNEKLRHYGIRDHQVKTTVMGKKQALIKFMVRAALTGIYGVLALPATVLNFPIMATAEIYSKKKQAEALASSTVKISAKDVVSSWKLVIFLGLTPTLYLIYAIMVGVLVSKTDATFYTKLACPLLTLILLPIISYYCLMLGDRFYDCYRSLRPLLLTIIGDPSVKELNVIREELSKEITELIKELGPKLFPNFEREAQESLAESNNSSPPNAPLTPSSQSALNWIMSPLDFVGEKFFDFNTPLIGSRGPSRSTSSNDLVNLMPLTKLEPLNPSTTGSNSGAKPASPIINCDKLSKKND